MFKGCHQGWHITSPLPTHQQPTNDLTDDDKDEEESGHTSYYVEHDADVVGKLFLVFDVGYQNRRDQKPNCNSKLCRRQTQPISYQMAKRQETNLETAIQKHNFSGWGDESAWHANMRAWAHIPYIEAYVAWYLHEN